MDCREASISVYTRAMALADGVLVDVTAEAGTGPGGMPGGFTVPVAVTKAVFDTCTAIPASCAGQSVRGRLRDVLWMARCVLLASERSRSRFTLTMPRKGTRHRILELVVVVDGGDDGRPVVTIMLPGEA